MYIYYVQISSAKFIILHIMVKSLLLSSNHCDIICVIYIVMVCVCVCVFVHTIVVCVFSGTKSQKVCFLKPTDI